MLGVTSIALRAAGCGWPPKTAADPISRWDFDETSSAEGVFEDKGPAHVLMVHAGTWAELSTDSLVAGVGGSSAYTDGSAYATMPADAAAHNLTALTISFYYQRMSASDKHILLAGGDGSEVGDFSIEVQPDGRLRGWHTGQDGVLRRMDQADGITGTNLEVGTAYRIELTLGPQGARVYLDGAELPAAAIPENTNAWNNSRVKFLGRWIDGVQAPAVGAFDRLRLWNRQLSAVEIAFLEPAISIDLPVEEPPPPDGEIPESPLDTHPGPLVTVQGNFGRTQYRPNSGDGQLYDAGLNDRSPPPATWIADNCGWTGPVRAYPVDLRNEPGGAWVGGIIEGEMPYDRDPDNYCNSASIIVYLNSTNFTTWGVRINRTWDGIRYATAGGGSLGVNAGRVEHCWISEAIDDAIDNVRIHTMYIGNNLVERSFVGIACDPGGTYGGPDHFNHDTMTIEDNLIWIERELSLTASIGGCIFKTHSAGPAMILRRNVFRFEHMNTTMFNRMRKVVGPDQTKTIEQVDNVWLWTGPGGWPNDFPASVAQLEAAGDTVLIGSAAVNYWNTARANWLEAHPYVPRIPGVDT